MIRVSLSATILRILRSYFNINIQLCTEGMPFFPYFHLFTPLHVYIWAKKNRFYFFVLAAVVAILQRARRAFIWLQRTQPYQLGI